MKTRITVESLTADLTRIRDAAERAEQFGAARGAVETLGKLHGHLIERKETGQPGDFSGLHSADEIIEKVRDEAGEDAAQLIADYIAKRTDVSASDADETKPSN